MTDSTLPLADLLAEAGDGKFQRAVAEAVVRLVTEADVEGVIGAGRRERTADRRTHRDGSRGRAPDTRLGTPQLRVPKLRRGSDIPAFPHARATSEKALVAVVQETWIGGAPTRRMDELVQAMGLEGISNVGPTAGGSRGHRESVTVSGSPLDAGGRRPPPHVRRRRRWRPGGGRNGVAPGPSLG